MPHQEYFPYLAARQTTRNILATELTAIANFNITAEFSATLSTPDLYDNKCGVTQAASAELIADVNTVSTKERLKLSMSQTARIDGSK
ncbi:hypothetical protein WOB81_22390 [Vibrio parahaemolyticus]|nr:hypothetical protein [Vibrio parahaemolyticus]MDG3398406.1 hypothetical protein [Vibrio parahaemolyticus]